MFILYIDLLIHKTSLRSSCIIFLYTRNLKTLYTMSIKLKFHKIEAFEQNYAYVAILVISLLQVEIVQVLEGRHFDWKT